MAGQLATASFDHQHPQAPDNRMQRPNLNARNEISPWIRWEGMQVYVVQEQKTYQLVGGTGNEHWQEIAAGGGASNFVGQFPTFEDLPDSGSPGDYAYVGTGDDFVQYNWDQIAGEWRLNSAETKVSDEDFFLGRIPSEPDRVMFSMRRNSIIYSTDGAQSISPDRMANYVFTGENVTLENVNYSGDGGEEFHITNRTGSNLTILSTGNFASGLTIPAGHMASFKSSDDGWVQSFVNEEATFSDTLDSVNAKISVGPDGKDVLSGIFDRNTGGEVQFKEFEGTPELLDGVMMVTRGGKYFKRVLQGPLNPEIYGYVGDGIADDSAAIQKAIDIVHATGGGVVMLPEGTQALVSRQGTIPFTSSLYGTSIVQHYCLLLKNNVTLNLNGSTIKLANNSNTAIVVNDHYDFALEIRAKNLGVINGIFDGNQVNQTESTGGSTMAIINFQNADNVRLDGLRFDNVRESSLKIIGVDFMNVGTLHTTWSDGNIYRLGAFIPTQLWESRVRFSNFDTLICENTQHDNYQGLGGGPVVGTVYQCSFKTIIAKDCALGHKFQDGCEYVTIGQSIWEGALEIADDPAASSSLRIQGGSFLETSPTPPRYFTVGEVICNNGQGYGLYIEYAENITVGSYVGKNNARLSSLSDVRIGHAKNVTVNSVTSINSGTVGLMIRADAYDVTVGNVLIENPSTVDEGRVGVQILGGKCYIKNIVAIDDRPIKRMSRGLQIPVTDAVGNVEFVTVTGSILGGMTNLSESFKIHRRVMDNEDVFSADQVELNSLNVGNNDPDNNQNGLTARTGSGYAVSGIGVSGPGVRGGSETGPGGLFVGQSGPGSRSASQNGSGAEGSSQMGPGGLFTSREGHAIDVLQFEAPALNQASAAARIRRTFTTDGGVNAGAPTLDVNDAAVASGPRNNPILNLRWDNVIKFQVDKDGRITIGNIREDRVENATNPTFVAGDRIKFLRLTGAAGNGQVPGGVYESGVELQGEVEGGAKTFVGTSGLTLRYPAGGTNVAPTNSRFFIKFKSPNDAQLTIVPSVIPENTYDTFIPQINGSTANPTASYTEQFGDYALIDRLCHFEMRLNWQSMSGGTGNIRIPLPVARHSNTANGGPAIAVMTGLSTSPPIYACYRGFNNIGFRNAAGNEISVSDLESEGVIALSGTYIIGG